MSEKKPAVKSFWFSLLMSILSLGMLAEYTRLVLTTDDSLRRKVVLVIWLVLAISWIVTSVVRFRGRGAQDAS
jgi:hypothetical protein